MNMDTNKKHTLPRAIILAACFLLLAGACDNYTYGGIEPDTPAKEVPLSFNASIERMEVTQSRTFAPTTDFTEDTYSFGMSITKSETGSEIFKGSSDMTTTMKRVSSSAPWKWSFIDNADQLGITPVGPEGKALKVVAYYPLVSENTKNVYTDGIPFDFSSKTNLNQTDLLYNTKTSYPFTPSDDPVTIPLHFQHAYTWIVLNIKKYIGKGDPCILKSVFLDNLGGRWIKNKGTIDPETGLAKDGATAGPIGVTIDHPTDLSTTDAQTYEFLVPSFMDTKVGDGEIILVLDVNGINELFILDKTYLNQSADGKSFGFRQGYKNTYDLLYNNSALSLSIQNWSSEVISGGFGGDIVPPTSGYQKINFQGGGYYWGNYPPKSGYLSASNHLYKNYFTTVAYGGNGAYVSVNTPASGGGPTDLNITDDINVYTNEKAYPIIQITQNDISVAPVPWEDENGELVAKELCRKYNGGGFHDWRLPRASELRAVFVLVAGNKSGPSSLVGLNLSNDASRNKPYWTGTEVDKDKVWGIYYDEQGTFAKSKLVLSPFDKKTTASVRCIRDFSN